MIRFLFALLAMTTVAIEPRLMPRADDPLPVVGRPLAGWPLRPRPGVVPSHRFDFEHPDGWFNKPGAVWEINPRRKTKFWHDGGLLWCDDPDCLFCFDTVYDAEDVGPDYPIHE